MKVSELFIKRPKMAILIMLGLFLFGIIAYKIISVSFLPTVEFPVIQVQASMSGASAETMASSVATPLEEQFTEINGLDSMSSSSDTGLTTVTLVFDMGRNIDFAAMDVQAAISRAQQNLPELDAPPSFTKTNPTQQPVIWVTLTSDSLRMSDVYNVAKNTLSDNISMIEGVGKVQIYGSSKFAVRIQLDPQRLATLGIGINEVAQAIKDSSVNLPLGSLKNEYTSTTIRIDGQIFSAREYEKIIVAYKNNQPVYLKDLGYIYDDIEDRDVKVRIDDKDAICLAVNKQIGANTINVVRRFYQKYEKIKQQIPGGINMEIFYDQSIPVISSINDVKFTLGMAIILVVIVIFFFLRNLLGMIIAALAIPLVLLSTFILMYHLNFTLDILSLLALTLAIGFVVDDAIVMIENIIRHLHMGKKPLQAAIDASAEIGFTIISITLSLIVVFVPILFMQGLIGRILHEFAMTISLTVLISGLITLTLTPMLCSQLLKRKDNLSGNGKIFTIVFNIYQKTLDWSLSHKWLPILIALLMLAGSYQVIKMIPKGFEPQGDLGFLQAFCVGREGISPNQIAEETMKLLPVIKKTPGVDKTVIVTGYPAPNNSFIGIKLKPYGSERKTPANLVVASLQASLNNLPGLWTFVSNPPMIPLGGKQTNSTYQYTIQSQDISELMKYSQELTNEMRGLKELQGVNSNLMASTPQVNVTIDRDKAESLGITARDIEMTFFNSYTSRRLLWIYASSNTYRVLLELIPEARDNIDDLKKLFIKTDSGQLVRLDSICTFTESNGFLTVNHTAQLPSATVSFNLTPGYSLLEATQAIKKITDKILPASITGNFEGMASAFEASLYSLGILLLLCIFIIYIILGILYEDFLHPLVIISGLPSATFGGLLILLIFQKELDLFGFVGLILLIGIVMKNAIMVVNFALEKQREGINPHDAIYQGALIRFRPIMMTTIAASMGALPIALGLGAGAEARQPLGLIIVGGLILSQFVTLYLTPVLYSCLTKKESLN